jgi:Gamma-glutamylcysteine synthetase
MDARLSPLPREFLREDVRRRFGIGAAQTSSPRTIGAEIELIPFRADNRLPVPIQSHSTACSLDILRKLGSARGWQEIVVGNDPPSWALGDGSRVSFEPGGQIELSSAPHETASALISELSDTCSTLADSFERHGITLETKGVDPFNAISAVPLQLHRERYAGMTRYFESIGPSGIRMMRQTASVQVNVQPGDDPLRRWKLLNRLAPVLVATFANSSRYENADTVHASFRAHLWRTLDPSRTGVLGAEDAVDAYCDFALDARSMFRLSSDGGYQSFEQSIDNATTGDDWDLHLSTLFPEIRPKGFFEVRSPDAIASRWLAAPIAIVAGLCYYENASNTALEILTDCDDIALVRAGELGVRDPALAALAKNICELAVQGCESLGRDYLSADDLDTVSDFVERYPANGRCPADDP